MASPPDGSPSLRMTRVLLQMMSIDIQALLGVVQDEALEGHGRSRAGIQLRKRQLDALVQQLQRATGPAATRTALAGLDKVVKGVLADTSTLCACVFNDPAVYAVMSCTATTLAAGRAALQRARNVFGLPDRIRMLLLVMPPTPAADLTMAWYPPVLSAMSNAATGLYRNIFGKSQGCPELSDRVRLHASMAIGHTEMVLRGEVQMWLLKHLVDHPDSRLAAAGVEVYILDLADLAVKLMSWDSHQLRARLRTTVIHALKHDALYEGGSLAYCFESLCKMMMCLGARPSRLRQQGVPEHRLATVCDTCALLAESWPRAASDLDDLDAVRARMLMDRVLADDPECPICMVAFQEHTTTVQVLSCSRPGADLAGPVHIVCSACWEAWSARGAGRRCPHCRDARAAPTTALALVQGEAAAGGR